VPDLPPAARLTAWGNAALTGAVPADLAATRVAGPSDAPHRLAGLPDEPEPVELARALVRLSAAGVAGLRLVLPRPGDPTGLAGPADFNERAVDAGAAVLCLGGPGPFLGLVPVGRAAWQAFPVNPAGPAALTVAEAERDLTSAIRAATEELSRLDVGRWDPAAGPLLDQMRSDTVALLPPSSPPQAHRLLALAQRLRAAVDIASAGEGGAVSTSEMRMRSAVLRNLDRAVRRATECACAAP
jgi:hypothetical protein